MITWAKINQIRLWEPSEIQTIQPNKNMKYATEFGHAGHMLPIQINYMVKKRWNYNHMIFNQLTVRLYIYIYILLNFFCKFINFLLECHLRLALGVRTELSLLWTHQIKIGLPRLLSWSPLLSLDLYILAQSLRFHCWWSCKCKCLHAHI